MIIFDTNIDFFLKKSHANTFWDKGSTIICTIMSKQVH